MSIVRIFGVFDGICAILFILTHFFSLPDKALFIIAGYLIIKGTLFTVMAKDIASIIDLICGLYALMIVINVYHAIATTLVILWLAEKSIVSFIRLG
ncbi:hypothetical protein JXB41_02640 [Candidatus Woesearchaeota archaeon]|nr:hypothetical protein [Candidatus Woesearchaeota archaeon]